MIKLWKHYFTLFVLTSMKLYRKIISYLDSSHQSCEKGPVQFFQKHVFLVTAKQQNHDTVITLSTEVDFLKSINTCNKGLVPTPTNKFCLIACVDSNFARS